MKESFKYKNLAQKIFDLEKEEERRILAQKIVSLLMKYGKINAILKLLLEIQKLEARKEKREILELFLPAPLPENDEKKIIQAVSRTFQVSPVKFYIVRHYSRRLKAGFIARKGDFILDVSLNRVLKDLKTRITHYG